MSQASSPDGDRQSTGIAHSVAEQDPLAHPTLTSVRLFDFKHPPGPHLRKVYSAIYRAVDPDFPNAPTRILILLPRGSGKSESAGVVAPTWLVLSHPHLRTAVISKTKDLAAERTSKAVDFIEDHAERFGVDLEHPVPRTEVETEANAHKEPTLAPYGIESQLTGKHFDVIIYDDIVDWENQRTATQRRNVRQYWRDYEKNLTDSDSSLPNGAVQIVIGTRKHPQDLYETDILESNRWHVIQHKAIAEEDWPLVENRAWSVRGTDGNVYDTVGDLPPNVQVAPDGVIPDRDMTVLWPERRPPGRVLYDLVDSESSIAIWRRENQLDPEALSGEVFKSDWLTYVDELPNPGSSYEWRAAMDVGVVEDLQAAAEGDSDYSAVAIAAFDRSGTALEGYVTHLARKRGLSVKQNKEWAADEVRDHLERFGVSLTDFPVEANKAPGVAQRLRDETDLPARPIESTSSKEGRIHDVGGAFESAELKIVGDTSAERWRDFEVNEWLQFPNAAHDDRLDVLSILWRELDTGSGEWSGSDVGLGSI